jgi:hypothetical protein
MIEELNKSISSISSDIQSLQLQSAGFFRKSGVHPSSISAKRNRTVTADPAA